ncbi:MAG: SDR family NAD(P)-dependent oxidoreductase, partial [Lysobacteraceae bacterium]
GEMRAGVLDDAQALVAALAARGALPEHAVWLAPADVGALTPQARLEVGAHSVFALSKALLRGPKRLRIVHLAPLGEQGEAMPDAIGLGGFYKTLAIEKPSFGGRVVQFAFDLEFGNRVADELLATDKAVDVRYLDGRREVCRFAPSGSRLLPRAATPSAQGFRRGGAYLVTGGMGALGLIVARHLCAEYAATVFLTGRSSPSQAQQDTLDALTALGGRAVYLACDVADRDDVRNMLARIRADLSAHGQALNGVLHSAGVIEDNFLLRKPADAFARVIAPKALGTWHLDLETSADPLDMFVLFSSVTGVFGNVGQCDYAFGNAFEDAFAADRERRREAGERSGKSVSINWPYWKDGGMRLSDKEEEVLQRSFGIVPLSTAHGLEALEYALVQSQPQMAVMPFGDLGKIHALLGVVADAAAPVAQAQAPSSSPAAGATGGQDRTTWYPAVSRRLSALFAKELAIADEFESDRPFKEYGFDSVVMIDLVAALEKIFGKLPKTLFFEYQTLGDLTGYFVEQHPDVCLTIAAPAGAVAAAAAKPMAATAAVPVSRPAAAYVMPRAQARPVQPVRADDPIAIIGVAGRYPQAENLDAFWANLCAGRDCIETIPQDRPDIATKFRFQPGTPVLGRSYSQWGGFLRDIDRFDAMFFNIAPKEADNMNPNERLMMEIAAHTIEDAGYTPDTLAAPRGVHENPVGVYIGMMWGDYQLHGVDRPQDEWAAPYGYYWAVPNRISHFFNFSGPSMGIDTACSSSLTAIHLACIAIRSGEIDVALAGAVNLSIHPNKYNMLADLRFLSSDGRCRAFGEGGDGYVPGEGVGAVLLKPLSKALADGDHVYAIVRGTAINHGGKTSGFTVPSPKRQAALIQDALHSAGVDPREISYVEAHGTGTSLGDPIEVSGLVKAFGQTERQYCAIGSAKSNIGHLEAAAGVAGLTKVLLQMQHRQLVPSIHSDPPNPHIDFVQSPFRVQRSLQAWERPVTERDGVRVELPRIAGISSFGAGGSNGHLIVEEFIAAPRPAASNHGQLLFPMSARRENALREMAARLAERLETDLAIDLADAAYTLQIGRVHHEFRAAFVVSDRASLVASLRAYAAGGDAAHGTWLGHRDGGRREPTIAALVAEATPRVPDWVAARDLAALARAWVNGVVVDWNGLHAGGGRRRIPLPGYAFQRQRYWLPEPTLQAWNALHPLIDANVSTLEEQTFAKTFRPDAFYLSEHRLGDNRILPGVAYLEIAIQAALLSTSARRPFALEDVRWMRPVLVGDTPVPTRIGLLPEADGVVFSLYAADETPRRPFAEGLIRLQDVSAPIQAAASETLDLAAIAGRCRAIEHAEVDAAFAAMGFSFGPNFRRMTRLHFNGDEALAHVRMMPIPGISFDDFVLHPALMDCAIRACIGIGGLVGGADAIRVPVRLHRIVLLAPLSEEIFAHATYMRRPPRDAQSDERHYDIRLCDVEGRVLVRIEGLSVRAAPHLALAARRPAQLAAAQSPAKGSAPLVIATPAAPPKTLVAPALVDTQARVAAATARLIELLSAVPKLPTDQIDPHAPLENYGIDSTMVLTLNERLSAEFGEVPKTLFYEHQELHGVAEYLAENHAAKIKVGATAQAEVAAVAEAPAVPSGPQGMSVDPREAVVRHLVALVSEATKLPVSEIDATAALENYGIDSTMILAVNARLAESFGEVPKTLFFEYQDLDSLSEYFIEHHLDQARALAVSMTSSSAVTSMPAAPIAPEPSLAVEIEAASAIEVSAEALSARLREAFGAAADSCGPQTPLSQWPFDPVLTPRVMRVLARDFEGLSADGPYAFAHVEDWAASLRWREKHSPQSPSATAPTSTTVALKREPMGRFSRRIAAATGSREDIAIVGLSGRYPDADGLDGFWRNLENGRDCITEIPESRWDYRDYFHPDRTHRGTVYSKWGAFIDGVDEFDASFFNMSAREAELIDPQERLFLQTAWECIESAGYTRQALRSETVGVFVGVMWANYSLFDVSDEQILYGRPCPPVSSIANRVSYFMNLSGPSLSLDTMCSSSLTAIHLAAQAMRNGDCSMAIAGGVNLILHPYKYQVLTGGQFLSTDGRCRAFGAGGDGYVPGEGMGAVMLKPLSRAVDDNDHIHGVIRASMLNHGGKTNGYTVPNQVAQSAVIGAALRAADWDPRTIDYMEAHGTGTSLGDPLEIAGLTRAYEQAVRERDPDASIAPQSCRIGSVKSNVGHLESAAGIAGLTKILLQMRHGRIVPSLHATTLNPNIDFTRSPFRVVQQLEDWDPPADTRRSRRAALSSFGAGGSNAHLLIEQYPQPVAPVVSGPLRTPVLFALSADSDERLALMIQRMLDFLHANARMGAAALRDLAYTSQIGREPMDERLAVVVYSVEELITALERHRDGGHPIQLHRGTVRRQQEKLESILNEEEKDTLIRSMLQSSRWPQLARAWVSMLDVDWARYRDALFPPEQGLAPPRRMPFPTMPFITGRYWIEERARGDRLPVLHPLIDRNVSTMSRQRFEKRFTGREFYLRDHIVRVDRAESGAGGSESGRMILPGAAYLEMVRAVGGLAVGDGWCVSQIRNLMWIQPFEIATGPDSLAIDLTQTGDTLGFDVLRIADGSLCVQGELQLRHQDDAIADEWLDLNEIRSRGRLLEPDRDAIYAEFRQMGFEFGESFRVTAARYRTAEGALCQLTLPASLRAAHRGFDLHPSLLDGILRSGLAIIDEVPIDTRVPHVPFALDALEYRHPLPETCFAYVTPARVEAAMAVPYGASGMLKYNIVVTDADGRVLAKLNGFSARPLVKETRSESRTLQYYDYAWRDAALPQVPAPAIGAPADARTLVLGASTALAEALSATLGNEQIVAVAVGDVFEDLGQNRYRLDPLVPAQWAELTARLQASGRLPGRIVHALALDDDALSGRAARLLCDSDAPHALRRGIDSLRHLFVALERAEPGRRLRCIYVYAAGEDAAQPQHDAVSGYARSLLTVNHRFELGTLQATFESAESWADAILAELLCVGANGAEIAYRDGVRRQRFPQPTTITALHTDQATEQLPLRDQGVYLITGGAGKLGLLVARDLAQRCKARLVLTGRSQSLNESQQAVIAQIANEATDVRYLSADTADADSVGALIREIVAIHGRLDGIVHCAGVAGAQPLHEIDDRGFDAMLSPKLEGMVLLDRATADMPLEFMVAFSSVSALIGDLGAGAYAVGNRFMDSYALWRERERRHGRRHGRTLSINWPLWSSGGMEISGGDASVFEFSGMQALTAEEGLQVLEALRGTDRAQVFVAVGDPERIARVLRLPSARDSMAALSAPVTPSPAQAVAMPVPLPVPTPAATPVAPPPAVVQAATGRAVQPPADALQSEAERFVKERLALILKTSVNALDSNRTFEHFGMESVMLLELHTALRTSFETLPKTALFEFDTPERLAQYLIRNHLDALRNVLGSVVEVNAPEQKEATTAPTPVRTVAATLPPRALPSVRHQAVRIEAHAPARRGGDEAVAIVGMAGEFPGAPTLAAFWDVIQAGRDCISEIPADRDFAAALAAGIGSRDGRGVRTRIPSRGGFVDDVALFDPALFRMTRREAETADPQLRVLLRASWRALEDAAYTADSLRANPVGVFVGSMNEDFTWVMAELHARIGDYVAPGAVASELANRISYLFDFRGPSLTVSTACSSSMTAVHLARQSILSGDCEVALACGVNLNLHATNYQMLQDMKVLSPDGVERTFDDGANGMVPGEGAGVVVLKRLDAALRDGDRIHGVLRASAVSHSGTGAGQYLPNIRILEQTAAQAIEASGLEAEDIGYIESHGTGTELGDPIELKALSNALRRSTDRTGFCAIGTRANFGHMEAASGVGALIKVLLAMRNAQLTPCINLRDVNNNFDLEQSPFVFPIEAREWPRNRRGTLAAGVNSFGMGGSNAFVVVESAPPSPLSTETGGVLILSARSAEALQAYLEAVVDAVDVDTQTATFGDLAYTSQVGRTVFDHRLAVVAATREDFLARARRYLQSRRSGDGVYVGHADTESLPELLAGAEGRAFVDSLVRAGQFDKLAALWVRGCVVDWHALHAPGTRRRASLPGMPFEQIDCSHQRLFEGLPAVAEPLSAVNVPTERAVEGTGWYTLCSESASVRDLLSAWHAAVEDPAGTTPLSEDYWRDVLVEEPGMVSQLLPALLHETCTGDAPLRQVSEQLDSTLVKLLQTATRRHQVDLQTMVAAAWAILVNRHTRAPSTQFGVLGAFRAVRDPADSGDGAVEPPRLLPIRVRTVGRQKIEDWLSGLQEYLLRKHAFHSAPLEAIGRWAGAEDLFDSVVVFETFDSSITTSADRAIGSGREHLASEILSGPMSPRMELVVSVYEDGVELRLLFRSETEDYSRGSVLLEQLIVLLQGLAEHPERNPAALSMRTRRDGHQGFWNAIESAVK